MKYQTSSIELLCWLMVGGVICGFVADDLQVSLWFLVMVVFLVTLDYFLFLKKYKRNGSK